MAWIRRENGRMGRGAEGDRPENGPTRRPGQEPGAAIVPGILILLGLYLAAVLAIPGEIHEQDGQALQGWVPVMANALLIGLAFAVAGFLLGFRLRRKAAPPGASAGLPSFREAFAGAPPMAFLEGGRLAAANPALESLLGLPEGGLADRDLESLLAGPAETLQALRAAGPDAASLSAAEALLKGPDGSFLEVEIAAWPLAWQGRAGRVLEVRDIRDRKTREDGLRKSEAALRKSEGSLRTLVGQSPVAFFAFDKEGRVTFAEGRALDAMGLRPGEVEGQSPFDKPSRLRALQGPVAKALDGQGVDEAVEMAGSLFEVRMRSLEGADGKPDGAMAIAMDVTELRRAEEDLRRSKEHLRTVVSNAPLVLFALDEKGSYTLAEGRGLEALGRKGSEYMGKSAFDIHRDAPQLALNVRRALSGEEFTSTVQIGPLWFETYYSPVFEGYDEVAGVIGVAINVTDRKRAEDALRRSEDQLRHSRKMEAIGRVAGGVAHDFNNLLTAITGYTELLLTKPSGGESDASGPDRKNLEEIRRAAERATTLTRQLLAFSRRQVLSPKVLNLNQTVSDMDGMLRRLIREDIDLVTVLDPRLGEVWVDPGQTEQVILNLALNARDAMPKGGQLTLETANVDLESPIARGELFLVPGPYIMLAISDTGLGMDEDVKSHLFEPFFTTKNDPKSEGNSLGLGLSAVYGIVKQSGGTIVVESEKGRGTTFKVYLPRADKGAAARRGNHPPESLHGEETVLLVEDEEAVRTLIREILAMHGYRVLEARSGGEAILASQRNNGPIHLLLTDVVMANMSGRELADHLRPLRPEMKILFISGYSEDAVLGEAGGFRTTLPGIPGSAREEAFLAKPFTPKTLALKVREVLDGKAVGRPGQMQQV